MNRRSFIAKSAAFPAAAVSASLTLREDGKPPIELDVSVLKLQPGDTIVLRMDGCLSQDMAERIKAKVEHLLPDVKAMVLSEGLTIDGVLRS